MYNRRILIYIFTLVNIISLSYSQDYHLPLKVKNKVDSLIIKYTGKEFYYNNYTIDTVRYLPGLPECQNCKPRYYITWIFKIKNKPFINERVGFPIDTCGNLVLKRRRHKPAFYPEGFPDCLKNPEKCQFSIDSLKAVSIANSYGFEKGLEKWEISFHWYGGEILDYVWVIQNTLEILKNGSRKGKVIIIDSNNGKILSESFWGRI